MDSPAREGELEALRSTVDALAAAEDELARQNDELAALRAAVEEEAARYRSLFESAPIAYVTTDYHGLIAEANAAAAELLGVEARFLFGKPLPLFVDEPDRRTLRRHLTELAQVGASAVFPARMHRRDNVSFDAALRATASTGELRWVIQDISEEHRAEERLWELNTDLERRVAAQAGELATVVEHLPVAVSILDADGTLLRANPKADQLLDRVQDGYDGTRYGSLRIVRADGSEVAALDRPVARAARGEVVENEIVYHEAPDGSRRAFTTSAAPVFDDDGNVLRVVLAFDDVTAQLAGAQAERDFVANAAHQIRTPITAIAAAVAALQAGAKDKPADRDRFLGHLEAEVGRLTRLGEALLTLTRTQRTRVAPDPVLVPLREVVDALIAEIAPLGVDVEVDCPEDAAALSNRPLLEQALANLLENAAKHGQGKPVTISARRAGRTVVIDVLDHGGGMKPVDLEHAFDRFYRGEDSTGGFGLGLPIAYEAIRAAGGTLELDSAPGTGTRARITIPGGRFLR